MVLLTLTEGRAGVSLFVEDFYLFSFDQDFDLTAVNIFEKDQHIVGLPVEGSFFNTKSLSLLAERYNAFDFSFVQQDGDIFTIGYQGLINEKGAPNRNIYGAITQIDGEFTKDEIDLNDSGADATRILNAKAGYVLLVEYFRKDKRMNLRLEKVNI